MTKTHICSKDFPEIIDFSRKTNLNVSKQLKNLSDSNKKLSIIKTFLEKTF